MNQDENWEHPVFLEFKIKLDEEDNFISNPMIDIGEGIIQCNKCKSKRTYSYQKQIRSSDEGFTLFVTCANCNASWREN